MNLRSGVGLALILSLGTAARLEAADSLAWRTADGRVDAHVQSWPLPRVLEAITSATGWQVYVEPRTEYTVTTQFRDLTPADALRRLLGDLNFALLPQPEGPAKLFIYRHSVNAATQLVHGTRPSASQRASKPIANELIVTLKRGAQQKTDRLPGLEARVVGRLDGLNAYRLQFKDEAAARNARAALERDDDVSSIENNFTIAPPADLEPLAMSSPAPLSLTPNTSPSADRVIVGLVDTAIQQQAAGIEAFLQPEVSLNGDYQPPADQITHGTAMAETILDGVARVLQEQGEGSGKVPVSILPIDVYGGGETTTAFDVARGLYEALDRHANLVNLSLAGDNDSLLLQNLIRDATNHGVLVFAAAGNTPVTTPTYPAADPGTIAVTAGEPPNDLAPYANRGAFVDAIAPGVNVVHYGDRAWLGTGTSFSTGWVTGWTAGLMAQAGESSSVARSETLKRWGLAAR